MKFRGMMAVALMTMTLCGPASSGEVHGLDGIRFEAPDRWAEFARIEGQELGFIRPDSLGRLSVYWWLPDEPLLGAPDILSHETITVAGRPALLIHYDFYSEESLKAVLLEPRADGRQLVLAIDFPKGETGAHDALLREVLASVRLDGDTDAPAATASGDAAAHPVDAAWLASRFGGDCAMVELETWRHPVRDVLERAGANRLLWLALCEGRTYPVFGMDFDLDPRGATRDYFIPLWMDMLDANGRWAFSVAVPRDNVMINVARDGSGIVLDEEDLDPATPGDEPAQPAGGAQDRDDVPVDGGSGGGALSGADPEDLPPVSGANDPTATPRNGMEAVMRDLNNYLKD